jgi:hypothetical protein
MSYRWAADAVLLLHLAFIAFVMFGALLALLWRWIPVIQAPAAVWGIFVELTGRICPLTLVENDLRIRAGASGYGASFVEHYLLRLIYPDGLTSVGQAGLAVIVIVVNAGIYGWILHRRRRTHMRA